MHRVERALLCLVTCGGVLAASSAVETAGPRGPARAETVKARRQARVFASPGDESRVVGRVRAGATVRVLRRRNRWLEVRVDGRTGWIARTSVVRVQPGRTGRSMRRRSAAEDLRARRERKRESVMRRRQARRQRDPARDDVLAIDQPDVSAAWKREAGASIDEGDDTRAAEANRAEARAEVAGAGRDEGGEQGSRRLLDRLDGGAAAGLGYSSFGQKFASASGDPGGAYEMSSGAAVVGVGGELVFEASERWLLAADLAYRYTDATPGLRYADPASMTTVDIGFKRHQIDLGGRAGYAPGGLRGLVAYGRLGYHRDSFRVDGGKDFDRNRARLPSEVLTGVTLGAVVDVPRLADRWAARVAVDALPFLPTRTQTAGLEDGATSHTFAVWGGALVQYSLGETYKVTGEYEYARARTRWRGAVESSMRPHMADWARRKDSSHVLIVGVGRSF